MMNKQLVYTVMGVVLSFIIAISGWLLTSMLIDKKSDALLSTTGVVQVNAPSIPKDADNMPDTSEETVELPKLTDKEILSVLQNWDTPGHEQLHEPVDGQIDIEQSIDAGKAGLSYFYEQGIIHEPLHENAKINAYLFKNHPNGAGTQTLKPYYSYWIISFTGENINAILTINAVTGQIWKADITLSNSDILFNAVYANNTLKSFVSYLDLSGDEKINLLSEAEEILVFQDFSDNTFRAAVRMKAGTLDNISSNTEIKMYLTTNESISSNKNP